MRSPRRSRALAWVPSCKCSTVRASSGACFKRPTRSALAEQCDRSLACYYMAEDRCRPNAVLGAGRTPCSAGSRRPSLQLIALGRVARIPLRWISRVALGRVARIPLRWVAGGRATIWWCSPHGQWRSATGANGPGDSGSGVGASLRALGASRAPWLLGGCAATTSTLLTRRVGGGLVALYGVPSVPCLIGQVSGTGGRHAWARRQVLRRGRRGPQMGDAGGRPLSGVGLKRRLVGGIGLLRVRREARRLIGHIPQQVN